MVDGNDRRVEGNQVMSSKHEYERKQITSPLDVWAFAFAGKAIFTLVGKGGRYTYKVTKSEDGKVYFVSVLTGSDNNSDYEYLGVVRTYEQADAKHWEFTWTKKSRFLETDRQVTGFAWFFRQAKAAQTLVPHKLGQVEFWHEGRCGKCGLRLTVPASIERGFGPECSKSK
jgi:hypothetical protein